MRLNIRVLTKYFPSNIDSIRSVGERVIDNSICEYQCNMIYSILRGV